VHAGNAWQADHIKAVHLGGGLCDITNFRTLCTVCHAAVTKQQAKDRARHRAAMNTRSLEEVFASSKSAQAGSAAPKRRTAAAAVGKRKTCQAGKAAASKRARGVDDISTDLEPMPVPQWLADKQQEASNVDYDSDFVEQ
jgi:hypothetical protein